MQTHSQEDSTYLQSTGLTPEYIEQLHSLRDELLQAIQRGDKGKVEKFFTLASKTFKDQQLNILNRVPNDQIRSYKNILLSHNTLYSYAAEKGGLSAWQCHFLSEKYAIMIEHANNLSELDKIHSNMLMEYSNPDIRKTNSSKLSIVNKAENYIEMNFMEDQTIEEIASALHVHPSHLMRAFKKEKGMTMSHYRNLRRIQEAKQLILFSNLTMTEIAVMVGIGNSQYFSKMFKDIEGVTPIEFRKRKKTS